MKPTNSGNKRKSGEVDEEGDKKTVKRKSERSEPPWAFLWQRDGVVAPTEPLQKEPVPADRCIFKCPDCSEVFAFEETLDVHRRAFCRIFRPGYYRCPYRSSCGPVQSKRVNDIHYENFHRDKPKITINAPILRPEFNENLRLLDSLEEVTELPGMPRTRFGYISFMHTTLPVSLLQYEYLDLRGGNVNKQRRPPEQNWVMDRVLPYHVILSPKHCRIPEGYEWGHAASWRNHGHDPQESVDCSISSNALVQHQVANREAIAEIEELQVRVAKVHPCRLFTGVLIDPGATSAIGKWIIKLILYQDPLTKNFLYDMWKIPNTDAATRGCAKFSWNLKEYNAFTGWKLLEKVNPTQVDLLALFPTTYTTQRYSGKRFSAVDPFFSLPQNMPDKISALQEENKQLRAEKEVLARELATLIIEQTAIHNPTNCSNEIGRTSSFKHTAGNGGGKSVGFQSEKSESSRDHDDDDGEITTEMKISEDPTVTVESMDVPMESKGLFFQSDSFDEEGDLPYVPTTPPRQHHPSPE